MPRIQLAINDVCDGWGVYDQFDVYDAVEQRQNGLVPQDIRDAVQRLTKEGLLQRVSRGQYRWMEAA